MNNVIEITASLAECYIFVRLCNGFLGFKNEKLNWLKSAFAFLFFALNDLLLCGIEGFENISIVIMILIFLTYSFAFLNGKVWEKMLVSLVPTITALPINLAVMAVFTAICGNERSAVLPGGVMRVPVLFFTKALFFFVCELIICIKRKRPYALTKFQWAIQLSCFFISFFISSILWNIFRNQPQDTMPFLVIFLLIGALNILIYILMNEMNRDNINKEEYRLSQIKLESQEQLVTQAREQFIETNALRHDMKHCLTAAAELLEKGENKAAKEYIETVLKEKVDTSAASVITGNSVIDAVVNNKLALCSEKKIQTKCQIDAAFGNISEIDMSILLANLLDNAIRGCENADTPYIELTVSRRKSLLYVIVKNTVQHSVLSVNPSLKTSKSDKDTHGFGIKSVRDIAAKYNGTAEFKESNGFFVAEICLTFAD